MRWLEIPTPRWSTYDAVKLGIAPPKEVPATIQERALASPIWFTLTQTDLGKARAAALTVASLEGKGAKTPTDGEIRELIVGRVISVKNTVAGTTFSASYGEDSKPTSFAGLAGLHGSAGLGTNPYEIKEGRLYSSFDDGSKFSSRIYKLGDRYVAARDDEAGYVNHEVTVKWGR